jgi:hypothetical protein
MTDPRFPETPDTLPAGTGPLLGQPEATTSPPPQAERSEAGADSQQAAAVGSPPRAAAAPGSLTALVDELYRDGDNLSLLMMAYGIRAAEKALARKPPALTVAK